LQATIRSSEGISKNTYVFAQKYVRILMKVRTYFSPNTYVFGEIHSMKLVVTLV